jgi:hypothetical protein
VDRWISSTIQFLISLILIDARSAVHTTTHACMCTGTGPWGENPDPKDLSCFESPARDLQLQGNQNAPNQRSHQSNTFSKPSGSSVAKLRKHMRVLVHFLVRPRHCSCYARLKSGCFCPGESSRCTLYSQPNPTPLTFSWVSILIVSTDGCACNMIRLERTQRHAAADAASRPTVLSSTRPLGRAIRTVTEITVTL